LSEPNEGISMKKITTKIASRAAVAAALSLGLTVGAVGVASASTVSHSSSSHSDYKWNQSRNRVEGIVSAYVAGTSISITSKGATTPTVYTLTSATTITGLAAGATLTSLDDVDLVLSNTTPATVTSIRVDAPRIAKVEGIVSAYVAGTSISITSNGAATPTVYTLTSATTITGLAAGATLASPTNVDLVLSTTTPTTVTSIVVEANGEGNGHGNGNCGSKTSGTRNGGFSRHGSHGFGSSKHGGRR
jgi:hypothetical protein